METTAELSEINRDFLFLFYKTLKKYKIIVWVGIHFDYLFALLISKYLLFSSFEQREMTHFVQWNNILHLFFVKRVHYNYFFKF